MDYFEKKIEKQNYSLYTNYIKLLEQNNTDIDSDLDRIINIEYDNNLNPIIPNYLTIFIKNFYEIVDDVCYINNSCVNSDNVDNADNADNTDKEIYLHYNPFGDRIKEIKRIRQEKINEQNYTNGLENYSIIIFEYFPIDLVKRIIQLFIENCIYNNFIYMEIKKFLFKYWKDQKVSNIVNQITDILVKTANLSKDEYLNILSETDLKSGNKKYSKYYLFWLYFFYPLIDEYEELIMKLINLVYLDDAQDELMNGLLRIESDKLLPFYKKFFIGVLKSSCVYGINCFDLFGSGTGSYVQNLQIIKKLKIELDWDFFSDQDLQDFITEPENLYIIECIQKDLSMDKNIYPDNKNSEDDLNNIYVNELLEIKYIQLNLDNFE